MRNHFTICAKFICCMMVSASILYGFSSIAYAAYIDAPRESGDHPTMNEPAGEQDVDKGEIHSHSHHSKGDQECHSISCNAYFASVHPNFYIPFHKIIAYSISTDQTVKSLLTSLYRPPRPILWVKYALLLIRKLAGRKSTQNSLNDSLHKLLQSNLPGLMRLASTGYV